jgi:hypothetical protein
MRWVRAKKKEDGFEVVAIWPGMLNTSMQQAVRLKTRDQYAMSDFLRQAYQDGK